MAKGKYSKDEWRRFKQFEQENEKLRKEVSKLRKQAKVSTYDKLAQKADRVEQGKTAYEPTCDNCGNEGIQYISISRKDGEFEMGVCPACQHKTKIKKTKETVTQ